MIREAAEFAAEAHRGAFRKGSRVPYIYHPMEVALIVSLMTKDEEVIAAAYLHDVLEDTCVTAEELKQRFGGRVCSLVEAETEDKNLGWRERREATIRHLRKASTEVKMIALADKLSNIRTTARDYLVVGDEVWERFNVKEKDSHRWYFESLLEALRELEAAPAYQEMRRLYEFVFGA